MITIKQLEIFVKVAQSGSITKASQMLYITQPAVSLSLSDFENVLDTILFDRIGKRIFLNGNGKKILPLALAIIQNIKELESSFTSTAKIRETIKISASTTIGNHILPRLMASFKLKHPHVDLSLNICNTEKVIEQILNYEYDIGFIEGYNLGANVTTIPFAKDELIFIVNKNHPLAKMKNLTLNDIKDYPFILREKGSGSRQIFEQIVLPKFENDIKVFLELGSSSAIRSAVEHSDSIGCISVHAYEENKHLKKLVLNNDKLYRELYIVQNKQRHIPFIVEEWIDWVCQACL